MGNAALAGGWRIAVISGLTPVVQQMVARLRALGHEPFVWLRHPPSTGTVPSWARVDADTVPAGVNLRFVADGLDLADVLCRLDPDLVICWGFPWKLPQQALDIARLGTVNQHLSCLPRHRGPHPLAWAVREGDSVFGVTWHRMDASFDTGPILAQDTVPIDDGDCTIEDVEPKLTRAGLDLLPGMLARVAAGDQGEPQSTEQATWAGAFTKDYAYVDWARSPKEIHNQVRAWRLVFKPMSVGGPFATLDGRRVKLLRTSLIDPGDSAPMIECGNGRLWIIESD
jgi:methionyl-tRNA formyltransferase